jgi:YVTN family beta-propeller protein
MINSFNYLPKLTYENSDIGIRMKYLPSWIVSDGGEDEENEPVIEFSLLNDEKIPPSPNFEIRAFSPLQDRLTLERNFNDTIQSLESPTEGSTTEGLFDFRLINSTSGRLENMDAMHTVTYSYRNQSYDPFNVTSIITIQNDRIYDISYSSEQEDYANHTSVINEMIQSIVFFEPVFFVNKNVGLYLEYPSDLDLHRIFVSENETNISFRGFTNIDSSSDPEFEIFVSPIGSYYNGTEKNNTYVYSTSEERIPADKDINERFRDEMAMSVLTVFNNNAYHFEYTAEHDEYQEFVSTVEKIINSTRIIDSASVKEINCNDPGKSNFTSYTSPYNFQIAYPNYWDNPVDDGNGFTDFVPVKSLDQRFEQLQETGEEEEDPQFSFAIAVVPSEGEKIQDIVASTTASLLEDARVLDTVHSNLTYFKGYSAYDYEYLLVNEAYDGPIIVGGFQDGPIMNMEKYIVNDKNDDVYIIHYSAPLAEFYKYSKIAQQTISCFDFTQTGKPRPSIGLKVGDGPIGIATNQRTNITYAANSLDSSVSVINSSNDEIITDIGVANGPLAIAVNPVRNVIYVTHSDSLSVIDGKNNSVVASIPLDMKSPLSIAVNPYTDKIYVADGISFSISIIDAGTYEEVDTIATGRSMDHDPVEGIGVSVDILRNRIYVANPSTSNVTVIDGSDNRLLANISTDTDTSNVKPHDIAVNPYTNIAYIVGESSVGDSFGAIDLSTNSIVDLGYDISIESSNSVAVNPFTNIVYVNDLASNTIHVFNGTSQKVMTNITTYHTTPSFLSVEPYTNILYTTNYYSDTVIKINGATNKILYGVTFDITDGRTETDNIFGVKIPFGIPIPVTASKSVDIKCNGKNILDNEYVQYDNDTTVECSVQSKKPFSPLISNSWSGFNGSDHIDFHVTKYGTQSGTFVDVDSLLQSIGPAISIFVLVAIVSAASIPSFSPKIREVFGTARKETELFPLVPDTRKDETTILSKAEIIGVDASVIVGVLILISLVEGFEVAELTQINIITATIVFPFAISAALAIRKHEKFATRLMIAGFICLMIAVILISLMRL